MSLSKPVAVILAAGRGTRMGDITQTIPKPLIPVLGKPAIQWVMESLAEAQIKDFIVVIGYLGQLVQVQVAAIAAGSGWNVSFVRQDQQLGTAHAMKLTQSDAAGRPVLLAFADIMVSGDNYGALIDAFQKQDCALVAGIRHVPDPYKAAAVYLSGNDIVRIIEKPPRGSSTTPWAHAGVYLFSNAIYDYIDRITPSVRGEYEITDAVTMMIQDGFTCRAQKLNGFWKDLATMEDVSEAELLMQNQEVSS